MANGFAAPRVIPGRRYAGMLQRPSDYYLSNDQNKLVERAKKFTLEKKPQLKREKGNKSVTLKGEGS